MAKHRLQLQGQTYGYFKVISDAGNTPEGKSQWLVQCVCGKTKVLPASDLRDKSTPVKSCGCRTRQMIAEGNRTHGMSGHPAYWVWRSMVDRCRLPTHQAWKNYGGRGIRVCSRWLTFVNFWADMGPTYQSGLSIERRDNSKGYAPENCYWATAQQQNSNKRGNRRIHSPWGFVTLAEASRRSGIGLTTLLYRLNTKVRAVDLFVAPDLTRTFRR